MKLWKTVSTIILLNFWYEYFMCTRIKSESYYQGELAKFEKDSKAFHSQELNWSNWRTVSPSIVECLKPTKLPLNTIKVKCKDAEGNKVTKYLPVIGASDPQEFLLNLWDKTNVLKERYNLIASGKMKFLMQSVGQALQGQCAKKWKKFASELVIANTTAARHENTTGGKWKSLVQDLSTSSIYFHKGSLQRSKG